jgi:hypothetical protein
VCTLDDHPCCQTQLRSPCPWFHLLCIVLKKVVIKPVDRSIEKNNIYLVSIYHNQPMSPDLSRPLISILQVTKRNWRFIKGQHSRSVVVRSAVEGDPGQGSNPRGTKKIPSQLPGNPINIGRAPTCNTSGWFGPSYQGILAVITILEGRGWPRLRCDPIGWSQGSGFSLSVWELVLSAILGNLSPPAKGFFFFFCEGGGYVASTAGHFRQIPQYGLVTF